MTSTDLLTGRRWRRRGGAPVSAEQAAQLAAARAAETQAVVDRQRALAQLRREQASATRQATLDAARAERELSREREAARAERRAQRRAARTAAARRLLARARLLVPLLIVNAAAVYGQIAYAYTTVAPAGWPTAGRLALAVLIAAAVESIAVYVGWHAHDALLSKATVTAARLRRASYLIAGAVGGINYAHFAGTRMAPTAAAVAFGLLSLLSPWLWGLHTRREQHVQLSDTGAVDGTGAVFSAERRRAFPVRTWAARRWSIDHNITDPAAAWAGYNTDRAARRAGYPTGRVRTAWAALTGGLPVPDGDRTGTPASARTGTPGGTGTGTAAVAAPTGRTGTTRRSRTGTGRRGRTGTRTDAELAVALDDVPRDWDGTVPVRRAAGALGCGPDRARRLLADAGLLRAAGAEQRTVSAPLATTNPGP